MSEPIRVGFIVEGPTDYVILTSIMEALWNDIAFDFTPLQPEMSEAFKVHPGEDGGWPGVYRWCRQTVEQDKSPWADHILFRFYDMLVMQLDADVADSNYKAGHIDDPIPGASLPCREPCPPPDATTDKLRDVVTAWMGGNLPSRFTLCLPSKAMETWAFVGMFPDDKILTRVNIECRDKPSDLFKGKPPSKKLISGNSKKKDKYVEFVSEIASKWDSIKEKCSEAVRFECELTNVIEEVLLLAM